MLVLRRSILTEKIARRGYHLSREYAVDPLEILFVREVMRTNVAALPADAAAETFRHSLHGGPSRGRQRLYPVIGEAEELIGVVTRGDLQRVVDAAPRTPTTPLASMLRRGPSLRIPTSRSA